MLEWDMFRHVNISAIRVLVSIVRIFRSQEPRRESTASEWTWKKLASFWRIPREWERQLRTIKNKDNCLTLSHQSQGTAATKPVLGLGIRKVVFYSSLQIALFFSRAKEEPPSCPMEKYFYQYTQATDMFRELLVLLQVERLWVLWGFAGPALSLTSWWSSYQLSFYGLFYRLWRRPMVSNSSAVKEMRRIAVMIPIMRLQIMFCRIL